MEKAGARGSDMFARTPATAPAAVPETAEAVPAAEAAPPEATPTEAAPAEAAPAEATPVEGVAPAAEGEAEGEEEADRTAAMEVEEPLADAAPAEPALEEPAPPPGPEDPAATAVAEKAAEKAPVKAAASVLGVKQYLESTVVSLLCQGLAALVKERPDDPIKYLATYLLKNNPNKKEAEAVV